MDHTHTHTQSTANQFIQCKNLVKVVRAKIVLLMKLFLQLNFLLWWFDSWKKRVSIPVTVSVSSKVIMMTISQQQRKKKNEPSNRQKYRNYSIVCMKATTELLLSIDHSSEIHNWYDNEDDDDDDDDDLYEITAKNWKSLLVKRCHTISIFRHFCHHTFDRHSSSWSDKKSLDANFISYN